MPSASHESPQTALQRAYLPSLRWALGHRAVTLVLAALVFIATVGLAPRLKTDFLGSMGATTLRVVQEMPAGTALEQTDAAAKQLEKVVAAEATVVSYTTTVGGDPSRVFFGTVAGPNQSSISVTLQSGADGTVVGDRLRAALTALTGVGTVEVVSTQANSDVALVVEGPTRSPCERAATRSPRCWRRCPGCATSALISPTPRRCSR